MLYNNVITRSEAQALIPEQVTNDLLQGVRAESAALSMFRAIPMSTNQTRMPVLAALPTAYFVNGDTGLKQTTETNWANKYLNVEEVAAIVPIPESVLDDTSFDVWGSIRPLLEQAIGRAVDAAIFFGVNKPASWPGDIAAGAVAAGNTRTRGAATQAQGGIAEDFNQLFATVEADGFDVNGVVASRIYRSRLRGARDTTGQALADLTGGNVSGVPLRFAMAGLWPAPAVGVTELVAGDFQQGIIGTRQDFTYKILDQAVIQDNTGAIIFNLAQQDMVALRVVFRCAFQLANTINYDQPTEASRYPFAVMQQP